MSDFDLVVHGGRVMDPESGLDAVRNVGIAGGVVRAISDETLRGRDTVDAAGLVVTAGFIDLHSHGQDEESYEVQARDGVTTALELEAGVIDVDDWYAERDGKAAINYGASSGHMPARQRVMHDSAEEITPAGDAAHRPATEPELQEITGLIERGLEQGALAVGLGVQYTPGASRWEILEVFRVAARHGATCHVHMRGMGHTKPLSSVDGLGELIAASAITGASLHVVHISSSGLRAAPRLLQMIGDAKSRGMDVTTECYPYDAALTALESAIFDEGWQEKLGIDYRDVEWTPTGERLTASTFAEFREIGGMVVMHMISEESVVASVASPLTMIASDGWLKDGKGHPRTARSYSRVLGRFVRENGVLTLMDALRKMSLMPAQRLEGRTPAMRSKGRLRVGADADMVMFDPERVIDTATYDAPTEPPQGIVHVLVHGAPLVSEERFQEGATPGRPVRAPITPSARAP